MFAKIARKSDMTKKSIIKLSNATVVDRKMIHSKRLSVRQLINKAA